MKCHHKHAFSSTLGICKIQTEPPADSIYLWLLMCLSHGSEEGTYISALYSLLQHCNHLLLKRHLFHTFWSTVNSQTRVFSVVDQINAGFSIWLNILSHFNYHQDICLQLPNSISILWVSVITFYEWRFSRAYTTAAEKLNLLFLYPGDRFLLLLSTGPCTFLFQRSGALSKCSFQKRLHGSSLKIGFRKQTTEQYLRVRGRRSLSLTSKLAT